MSEVGVYKMNVIISDTKDTATYPFKLTVTNKAPQVIGPIPTELILTFGQDFLYTLPASMDPEGLPY